MQSDTNKPPCELCNKPANTHCLDCKQYLCNQCCKQHGAFKPMKGHKVVAASDVLSGKVSSKGRHCEVHGELIRFYCNSEDKQVCQDCITLKTCAIEHDRVTLAEAAKKQVESLQHMASKCASKKEMYAESLLKSEQIRAGLHNSYVKASGQLENMITKMTEKLEQAWMEQRAELSNNFSIKDKKLNDTETELKTKITSTQKACDLAEEVLSQGSDHVVTYEYATLKTNMQGIIVSPDQQEIDESLSELSFDSDKSEAAAWQPANTKSWRPSWNFQTDSDFHRLRDVVFSPNSENITIASEGGGVKILTKLSGDIHCTFRSAPKYVYNIAVTPDERYIINARSKLLHYDRDGNQLKTVKPSSIQHRPPSPPVAVAVDNKGKIIVGLQDNTIAIHYADGSLERILKACSPAYYISTTSKNKLVVTFENCRGYGRPRVLKVVSYFGQVLSVLLHPDDVYSWDPGYTCCSGNDEVFVINESGRQILSYTLEGSYLGLVTTDVDMPRGITVSDDGYKLVVVQGDGKVKSFCGL